MSGRFYPIRLLLIATMATTATYAHAELLGTASTNGVSPFSPREGDSPYNAPANTVASASPQPMANAVVPPAPSATTGMVTPGTPQGNIVPLSGKKSTTTALGI